MAARSSTTRACGSCIGVRPVSRGGRARGSVVGKPAAVDLDADARRHQEAIRLLREARTARYEG